MPLYIDESGVLDLQTRYFIIAGVLAPTKTENRFIKRTMTKAFKLYAKNSQNQELHGSELKSWQKQNILNKLCSSGKCQIVYLVVDKQKLELRLLNKTSE